MLAGGASERDHQVLEPTTLISADARIHQRLSVRQKLMHAWLFIQIFDYGSIFSRELFKTLFTTGIGQAPPVKDEATAISRLIFRQIAVKREAEYSDCQALGLGWYRLNILGV